MLQQLAAVLAAAAILTAPAMAAASGSAPDDLDPGAFGAIGSGVPHPIGKALGVRSLAALAAYRDRAGRRPYGWARDPIFGLDFTVPLAVTQRAAGTRLEFAVPADNLAAGPVSTAYNYADQADAVLAGMAVSGRCIATGTRVATVVSALPTSLRTSAPQPTPGRTLRFPFTSGVVVGELVAGPGIPADARVAAVTSDTVTLTSGTGVALGANAVVGFAGAGFLDLSRPTMATCYSGAAIRFSLSDRQVQALDMDWLGLQAAVAAAWASPSGGTVHIPRGDYLLDRMVTNPGIMDSNDSRPQVEIAGDGMLSTRLHLIRDTGYGSCALGENNRSQHSVSRARYRDFRLIGPSRDMGLGHAAVGVDGLCLGEKARAERVQSGQFRAGFSLMRDHQVLENVEGEGDFFGLELAANGDTFGNQHLAADSFSGTLAGIAVAWNNAFESALFDDVSLGFSPYSLYREAAPVARTPGAPMIVGCTFTAVYGESIGNGFIYGENGAGDAIDANVWTGVSPVLDPTGRYRLPGRPVAAVVHAGSWFENTMIGSDFANPANDRLVTNALFDIADAVQANKWLDPISSDELVADTGKPMFVTRILLFDSFATDRAAGEFRRAEQPVAAGKLLASGSGAFGSTAILMQPGLAPLGVALTSARVAGDIIAVARSGIAAVAKTTDATLRQGDLVAASPAAPGAVTRATQSAGIIPVGVVSAGGEVAAAAPEVWVELRPGGSP